MFSSDSIPQKAADLAWSLWTELGVSGVVRNHADTMVDPEPLLAVTPTLAGEDVRLLEQVLCWCAAHGDRINTVRLTTIVDALPPIPRASFLSFAATINAVGGSRWPSEGPPWSPLPRMRPVVLPLERVALVRLRARALWGLGTRADVLCDLAGNPGGWSTASDLAENGHSKRNIARTFADFEAAGVVIRQLRGKELRFRLAQPAALGVVLGGLPTTCPPWTRIFSFVLKLMEVQALRNLAPAIRRVEANTLRDVLLPMADGLWLKRPPGTRGEPAAWELLSGWAEEQLSGFAGGSLMERGPHRLAPPAQS